MTKSVNFDRIKGFRKGFSSQEFDQSGSVEGVSIIGNIVNSRFKRVFGKVDVRYVENNGLVHPVWSNFARNWGAAFLQV